MSRACLFKVKTKEDFNLWFENGGTLGRGAYATVSKVVDCKTGKVVAAIKHVDLTDMTDERSKQYAKQEVILFFIII